MPVSVLVVTPTMLPLQVAVSSRIEAEGLRPLAGRLGVGVGDLRSIRDGRGSRAPTIERVAAALGLEFYIGPPRGGVPWGSLAESAGLPELAEERLRSIAVVFEHWDRVERATFVQRFRNAIAWALDSPAHTDPLPAPAPVPAERGPESQPVSDRRLAEVLAVLADAFEEYDGRAREDMIARFWGLHPDLRERAIAGEGRRLARLAGG